MTWSHGTIGCRPYFNRIFSKARLIASAVCLSGRHGKARLSHGTGTGTVPVPVPVPAVLGAVPIRSKIVTVLVRNGTGTDRSSYRSGRSSGRFWPFPFPFCRSWVGMVTDSDLFWTISAKASDLAASKRPSLGWKLSWHTSRCTHTCIHIWPCSRTRSHTHTHTHTHTEEGVLGGCTLTYSSGLFRG